MRSHGIGWIALLLALRAAVWAGSCTGDSLSFRFLPEEIGVFNSTSRVTVQLPCDTMIVEAGKMTTVYPNTLLHFGPQVSENCVILVRGQLYAKGKRLSKILFGGDLDSTAFGVVTGKGLWAGLWVDTLGSVYFSDVEVKNASTAIIFKGRNSQLEKVTFLGSYGLILPGGRNYPLDPKGVYFPTLDILNPPKSTTQSKEIAAYPKAGARVNGHSEPKAVQAKSSSGSQWIWYPLAASALVAGGAMAYVYWPNSPSGTGPIVNVVNRPDPLEDPPPTPTKQGP